ncbi:hypothetical protein ALC62_00929 [Cyphomyrmex costatus]|uniref:Uncharacterized protein n=1 Tax=Cyphomyrmex costatus TaxID=456900 RepID=A0A195D6N4_9HYME|nr:hypothetical protein ALC62_00929 [Cyphomyrmex costatus]
MAEHERSTVIEPAIRYFEVHPIVASADCETRMQIPARILRARNRATLVWLARFVFYISINAHVLVFLGMLSIVLQRFQNSIGDWRRDWQMLALRMETIFISAVAQTDRIAAGIRIAERSLNANSVLVFGDLEKLTLLLRLNAISSLIAVAV